MIGAGMRSHGEDDLGRPIAPTLFREFAEQRVAGDAPDAGGPPSGRCGAPVIPRAAHNSTSPPGSASSFHGCSSISTASIAGTNREGGLELRRVHVHSPIPRTTPSLA